MNSPEPRGKILSWQPIRNPAGSMVGIFALQLPSGMIVNDFKLMIGPGGKFWIASPATKLTQPDGSPVIGANGKPAWHQFIEFSDRRTRERFEQMAIDALREAHPEALEPGGP